MSSAETNGWDMEPRNEGLDDIVQVGTDVSNMLEIQARLRAIKSGEIPVDTQSRTPGITVTARKGFREYLNFWANRYNTTLLVDPVNMPIEVGGADGTERVRIRMNDGAFVLHPDRINIIFFPVAEFIDTEEGSVLLATPRGDNPGGIAFPAAMVDEIIGHDGGGLYVNPFLIQHAANPYQVEQS